MLQHHAARFVLRHYYQMSSVLVLVICSISWGGNHSKAEESKWDSACCMKLHYSLVATDGMPLLTSVQWNSRHQNAHAHQKYPIQEPIIISTLSSQALKGSGTFCQPEDTVKLPSLDSCFWKRGFFKKKFLSKLKDLAKWLFDSVKVLKMCTIYKWKEKVQNNTQLSFWWKVKSWIGFCYELGWHIACWNEFVAFGSGPNTNCSSQPVHSHV